MCYVPTNSCRLQQDFKSIRNKRKFKKQQNLKELGFERAHSWQLFKLSLICDGLEILLQTTDFSNKK